MARLRSEAEGGLAIRCEINEREMLLMAAPEVFYITDHYENSRMILVNLEIVNWHAMKDIIVKACRMAATPRLIKEYDDG